MLDRRRFMGTALAAGASLLTFRPAGASLFKAGTLVIYKSPTCGCCSKWVDHVKAAGFETQVHDVENMGTIKSRYGVPADLSSCHTALIDNYVIEGHVPADLIQKLLKEKPEVAGLAVPGMPAGSPGMEMGTAKDAYDVLTFTRKGKTAVFARR